MIASEANSGEDPLELRRVRLGFTVPSHQEEFEDAIVIGSNGSKDRKFDDVFSSGGKREAVEKQHNPWHKPEQSETAEDTKFPQVTHERQCSKFFHTVKRMGISSPCGDLAHPV
jgi:hypothetical protein